MALEEEGYAVAEAGCADAAIASFEAGPAALVLVDLMLTGMSGLGALPRPSGARSDGPIIVVTAKTDRTPLRGEIDRALSVVDAGLELLTPALQRPRGAN